MMQEVTCDSRTLLSVLDNCRIRTIVCHTFGILGVKRCSHKRKSLLFTHSELMFMTRVAGKFLYALLFQDVLVEVQQVQVLITEPWINKRVGTYQRMSLNFCCRKCLTKSFSEIKTGKTLRNTQCERRVMASKKGKASFTIWLGSFEDRTAIGDKKWNSMDITCSDFQKGFDKSPAHVLLFFCCKVSQKHMGQLPVSGVSLFKAHRRMEEERAELSGHLGTLTAVKCHALMFHRVTPIVFNPISADFQCNGQISFWNTDFLLKFSFCRAFLP